MNEGKGTGKGGKERRGAEGRGEGLLHSILGMEAPGVAFCRESHHDNSSFFFQSSSIRV